MDDDIFDGDPLLLERESQIRYGERLLSNVLVGRTTSSEVRSVNLHAEEAAAPQKRTIHRRPPQAVCDNYKKQRIYRTKLADEDMEKLAGVTLVSRGDMTARRLYDQYDEKGGKRDKFEPHEEASELLKDSGSKLDQRLRIAAIGFRVKVSKLEEKAFLDEDLCMLKKLPRRGRRMGGLPDPLDISELGRTTLSPAGTRERWTSTICSHITKAVDSGAQLIVLPEFALPPDVDGDGIEKRLRQLSDRSGGKKRDHFIFAGSRHEGLHNRGLLFHWKGGRPQPGTKWHYKAASARSLGENIHGPASLGIAPYKVKVDINGEEKELEITVAICFDSFDPTTFLSLVRNSVYRAAAQRNRIILVPSFNRSKKFVEFLRDLSFLTRCTVIYVNSLHGDARTFVGGFAIKDIFNASGNVIDQLKAKHSQVERLLGEAIDELKGQEKKGNLETQTFKDHVDELQKREAALDSLWERLTDLKKDRGFEHLITVEHCQTCADKAHEDDYECASDILYYNIDARLLRALLAFRVDYLENDASFMPKPFRKVELEKAVFDESASKKGRAGR